MNKKVVGVAAILAIIYMSQKTPTKKNNYLYLEVPEEAEEELPDMNSPADQDAPMSGYKKRTWLNGL